MNRIRYLDDYIFDIGPRFILKGLMWLAIVVFICLVLTFAGFGFAMFGYTQMALYSDTGKHEVEFGGTKITIVKEAK